VGVFGEEERAEGVLGGAILDDGLGDGGDVVVIKRGAEGAAAMSRCSKGHALGGDGGVGMERVEGRDEVGNIDQGGRIGEMAGLIGWGCVHALGVLAENGADNCTI
jgi:hypothetical protein